MHEHGCPWDRGMLLSAGICCSVEMVEWMATNGYDFGRVVRSQHYDSATPASMPRLSLAASMCA